MRRHYKSFDRTRDVQWCLVLRIGRRIGCVVGMSVRHKPITRAQVLQSRSLFLRFIAHALQSRFKARSLHLTFICRKKKKNTMRTTSSTHTLFLSLLAFVVFGALAARDARPPPKCQASFPTKMECEEAIGPGEEGLTSCKKQGRGWTLCRN